MKLETLQEFVSANVGVQQTTANSALDERPAAASQEEDGADAVDPHQENFTIVRNGFRPKVRKIIPITECQNRFQILTNDDAEAETEEIRLVGDSMIRGQLNEFCARAPKTRKRLCIPGGGVDDVTSAVEEVSKLAPACTTYIIHVGTNDVQRTRSEELMSKYKNMIKKYKDKKSRIIISGIVPRIGVKGRFYNIATSINRRLADLCKEEDVGFINTWDKFYYDNHLFSYDGVHLNQVGAARFGRLLDEAVKDFRRTMGQPGRRREDSEVNMQREEDDSSQREGANSEQEDNNSQRVDVNNQRMDDNSQRE